MEALLPFVLYFAGRVLLFLVCLMRKCTESQMFRVAQGQMDNIWSRWLEEYLPVHNIRQKW